MGLASRAAEVAESRVVSDDEVDSSPPEVSAQSQYFVTAAQPAGTRERWRVALVGPVMFGMQLSGGNQMAPVSGASIALLTVGMLSAFISGGFARLAPAPNPALAPADAASVVVFRNVRVFYGTSRALSSPSTVVVRGQVIERITSDAIQAPAGATTIDGRGRTLAAWSGPRDAYPGELGSVEEGARADLLLVDGDPLANPRLLENPASSVVVIMKDGKIRPHLQTR
jgi:hypothetical protein